MIIRLLSMSATLMPAVSASRSPVAYGVVSAARAFRLGTASRKRTTSSAASTTGSLRGVRAYGIRSGRSAETVHNLGGLMRHGETGDGPIVRRLCDPY